MVNGCFKYIQIQGIPLSALEKLQIAHTASPEDLKSFKVLETDPCPALPKVARSAVLFRELRQELADQVGK